jgi:hypothetical protein
MPRTHGYRLVRNAVVDGRAPTAGATIVDPRTLTTDALYHTKKIHSRAEFLDFLRDASGALPDVDRGR